MRDRECIYEQYNIMKADEMQVQRKKTHVCHYATHTRDAPEMIVETVYTSLTTQVRVSIKV